MQGTLRAFPRLALPYVATFAAVVTCTGAIAIIRWQANVGNISTVYLLAVLASAVAFGSRPAVVAAVASFLAYDFFFIQPQFTLTVANEDEWIALILLLITGVVTGQLAAAQRKRAIESARREKEAVVLYDVVSLMTEPDLQRAVTAVAQRLRTEAELAAVVIEIATDAQTHVQAVVGDPEAIKLAQGEAAEMILAYGRRSTAAERGTPGRWVRLVQPGRRGAGSRSRSRRVRSLGIDLAEQRVGTIVMVRKSASPEFGASEDRLVSALARQLRLTLERLRFQREANEGEIFKRTDELRTALINAVSHDLRTPLSSIIASAGSLRQRDVKWSEDERIEVAEAIEGEAGRLNRLVGNLLDLSRIEAGNLRPEKGWYDLRSLVREVVGRLRGIAPEHHIVTDLTAEIPPLHFDYVEIDQVISNLIENALKYTPPGEITVSLRVLGGSVEIAICDSGPGLAVADLPHVFDPFYRGGGSVVQGSGLGLSVAKGLVEAHGGAIRVTNRSEGGARFAFTLPLEDGIPSLGTMSELAG
jgi:two-component system, OmpR family, sensor histidine kinase KdpD